MYSERTLPQEMITSKHSTSGGERPGLLEELEALSGRSSYDGSYCPQQWDEGRISEPAPRHKEVCAMATEGYADNFRNRGGLGGSSASNLLSLPSTGRTVVRATGPVLCFLCTNLGTRPLGGAAQGTLSLIHI